MSPQIAKVPLRKWFEGTTSPPNRAQIIANKQGRLDLSKVGSRSYCIFSGGLLPGQPYAVTFREEKETLGDKEHLNYCADVTDQNGQPIGVYYLRFRDKTYATARLKERALKDAQPAPPPTPKKVARDRNKLVRDYLEGRAANPGPLPYEVMPQGSIYLTSLSTGQTISLDRLCVKRSRRACQVVFIDEPQGRRLAEVHESTGEISMRYSFEEKDGRLVATPRPGQDLERPTAQPEVAKIRQRLSTTCPPDFMTGIKTAPVFNDPFQAIWWAHNLREQTGKKSACHILPINFGFIGNSRARE